MVDKVRPLKVENPAEGGTETDHLPTEADPSEDYLAAKGVVLENDENKLVDATQGGLSTNMDITFYPNISGYRYVRIKEDASTQPDSTTSTIMVYTGSPDELYQVNFGSEEEPDWRDYRGVSGSVTLKSYDGNNWDAGGQGQAGSTGAVTVTSGNAGGGDTAGGNSGTTLITTGNCATGTTGSPGSPGWLYIYPGTAGASGETSSGSAHVIIRGGNQPEGWGADGGNAYIYGGKGIDAPSGRVVLGFEPFGDYTSPVSIGTNGGSAQLNVYNSAYFDYLTASKLVKTDGSKNIVSCSIGESDIRTTSLTNGKVWIGNGSNIAAEQTVSGDVTISNTGVTTIGASKVTSSMIVDGTIVNGDINASAAIDYSKLATLTSGNIVLGNASNVATSTAVTGDVTISSSGVTAIGTGKVTSTMILDGTILNADINASAAIAWTKLANDSASRIAITNGSGTLTTSSNLTYNGTTIDYSHATQPRFRLLVNGSTSNDLDINMLSGRALTQANSATSIIYDIDAIPGDGTSSTTFRWNRNLTTTGANSFNLYRGDGTSNTYAVMACNAAAATTVFNNTADDIDFVIKGDTETSLFYVDAGNDRLGLFTSSPTEKLHLAKGNILHEVSSSGATVSHVLSNTSNTASAKALHQIKVAGTTADDPYTQWLISGGATYTAGIDNSVTNDPFVMSRNATLGTNNFLVANSSNNVNFPGSGGVTIDNSLNLSKNFYHIVDTSDTFTVNAASGPSDPIMKASASGFGTGSLQVDSNGVGYKFGVGSTAPTQALHVSSGNALVEKANSGGTNYIRVGNTTNNSTSHAKLWAYAAGGLTYTQYTLNSLSTDWSTGIDDGQGYSIRLGTGTAYDSNTFLNIDATGVTFTPKGVHSTRCGIPIGSNGSALNNNGDIEMSNYSSVPGLGFQIDGTKYYIAYYGVIV